MAEKSYRELIAWQKAMDLVEMVYRFSGGFPNDEKFGLMSQIRRAAVSVPSNIAEGQGRATTGDFLKYLAIARGSLCELETQVLISQRLYFGTPQIGMTILNLSAEVGRILNGLINRLRQRQSENHHDHDNFAP